MNKFSILCLIELPIKIQSHETFVQAIQQVNFSSRTSSYALYAILNSISINLAG